MTAPEIITLIVTILAAILLISEVLRPDLVALMVLVTLVVLGIVTPAEAFSGFSGSAVITILGISIISEGLRQTGVTSSLGRMMHRLSSGTEERLTAVVTTTSALLSLVMNNIAAVGVILPATLTLARRGRISPSRLLLPLAYGVGLGGMATLFTTANLIVGNALKDAGYQSFGMLDFLPIGGVVMVTGILFVVVAGRRLLPSGRESVSRLPQQVHASLFRLFALGEQLSYYELTETSPLAGRSLRDSHLGRESGLRILRLDHAGRQILMPGGDEIPQPGDRLIAAGPAQENPAALGLTPLPVEFTSEDITNSGVVLVELLVSPHGSLPGQTLVQADLYERYGINVLSLWRDGKKHADSMTRLKLRDGDALLVQAPYDRMSLIQAGHDLILLEDDPDAALNPRKYNLALGITFVTLLIAAAGVISVPVAVVSGAVLMLLTGCIQMDAAYASIEWKAIFLIAGMWPLSIAIRSTGLADHAVNLVIAGVGDGAVLPVIIIILLAGALVTQVTGGQVAALILAPIAITSAQTLGVPPYGLAMAAALACSLSFPTPYGHPVNIMVMTPGGYRFRDYVRLGLPLTILASAIIVAGTWFFYYAQ